MKINGKVRLKHKPFLVGAFALLLLLVQQIGALFGYDTSIYNERVTELFNTVLAFLVLVGVVNGKYCPHRILSEDRWNSFLNRIKKAMEPNESEQQIIEDDDTMKFTNTTAKAAVRDYIQQAVDKGLIDKSWLVKFENGTMTSGDFEGL